MRLITLTERTHMQRIQLSDDDDLIEYANEVIDKIEEDNPVLATIIEELIKRGQQKREFIANIESGFSSWLEDH